MRRLVFLPLAAIAASTPVVAQVNAGTQPATEDQPFSVATVATFELPWKLAFLPDERMLVTEKTGSLWLVSKDGTKTKVGGVPVVLYEKQQGLLGVYLSPTFRADRAIYLTYAEPGEGGSSLALAHARLKVGIGEARLERLRVIWRDLPKGLGGQVGGVIAFAPDNRSLFMTVGERQRMTPAQDPDSVLGKIVHLTLEGKPARGNPGQGRIGAPTRALLAPPRDTESAKTAPVEQVRLPGPNLAPSEIWASGLRMPYGLVFDSAGRLWEMEHGPRGGDELNLIEKGGNYGWPLVSYGTNYNGVPIPHPDTRPDLIKPVIYWAPVIAPAGMVIYHGAMFPKWDGSALAGGLASKALVRITFDGKGGAQPGERWVLGKRIRDVEVASDGAVWLLEDSKTGALMRLTPKP